MTETELEPPSASTNSTTWDAAFAALKARFPKAKDSIIFAIHALQSDPDIALDDLKARADMHGIRVTAASVRAARRLMVGHEGRGGQPDREPRSDEAASRPPNTRDQGPGGHRVPDPHHGRQDRAARCGGGGVATRGDPEGDRGAGGSG